MTKVMVDFGGGWEVVAEEITAVARDLVARYRRRGLRAKLGI